MSPLITSSKKFQRTYQLEIKGQDGVVYKIGSEDGENLLTMQFSVNRDVNGSSNIGHFRIFNLNPSIRNQLYYDFYTMTNFNTMTVKAGYIGTPLSTIFKGNAQSSTSCREEGEVDFVTEIEGHDFTQVIANSFSSWTIGDFSNPVTQRDVIFRLIKDMQITGKKYGAEIGVGLVDGFNKDRYTYTANDFTWNLLQVETDRLNYMDLGKVYCIPNNIVFPGDLTILSSDTGLLGTPKKSGTYVIVDMLFEPSLTPGQEIFLDANLTPALNSLYNGTYKVTRVQHSGIISNTVSGKCKTVVTLQLTINQIRKAFIPNPNSFVLNF